MGYRSDVRSVIYGPTEVMLPFIAEAGLKRRKVWKQFPGSLTQYEAEWEDDLDPTRKTVVVLDLSAQDVKWYEGDPEEQAWAGLLRKADETEGLMWEFIRIGESCDDVEMRRSDEAYWLLGIQPAKIVDDIVRVEFSLATIVKDCRDDEVKTASA